MKKGHTLFSKTWKLAKKHIWFLSPVFYTCKMHKLLTIYTTRVGVAFYVKKVVIQAQLYVLFNEICRLRVRSTS